MLTREVPFKGFEGLQVAWLVVEKQEVTQHAHAHAREHTFLNTLSACRATRVGGTMRCSHGFHCELVRLKPGIFRPDVSSLLL